MTYGDGQKGARGLSRGATAGLLAAIAAAWVAFDALTKQHFNAYEVGEVVAGPFLGLFRFRLVHNTGAAWGLFDGSTLALGVLSLAVCAVLTGYLLVTRRPSAGLVVGGALVVAGGIGNAIDRFTLGYVVDFIEAVFVDFPVFNVADIGVTCGFVIFVVALLLDGRAVGGGSGVPREAAQGQVGE